MPSAVSAHPPGGQHRGPEPTAALFSMRVAFAAGYSAVYQAIVEVFAGIIRYAFVRAHRQPASAVPAPADPATAVTRGENPEEPS